MRDNLYPDETLMPERFKSAGYATLYASNCDMGQPPDTTPWQRGWDKGYSVSGYQHGDPRLPHRGKTINAKGWTCNIKTDQIIDLWKQNPDRPWFATAASIIPHLPFLTNDVFAESYRDTGLSDELALCFGSITQMDAAIGRLSEGLRRTGREKTTIVLFVSDNGMSRKDFAGIDGKQRSTSGWKVRNKHGLRGHKASAWENGIRLPCLIRWPDQIAPGRRKQLGGAEGIHSTLLDLAGIDPSSVKHHPLAGVSLHPALKDANADQRRSDLFRITISGEAASRANPKVRRFSDHHLVLRGPRFKYQALPNGKNALYDLACDSGETRDSKSDFPAITQRMSKEIRTRCDAVVATESASQPHIDGRK